MTTSLTHKTAAANEMSPVGVSIINYRTPDMTIRCAASALEALEGVGGHVTVVDNFSGDDSVRRIGEWIDGLAPGTPVRLVTSPRNTGF